MLCGSLDGGTVWGRMDTYMCMAESLCCPPETITILLTGYTPIQNKKFRRRKKELQTTLLSIYRLKSAERAQLVKNPPVMRETWVDPCVGKIPWRRERLPTPVFWPGEFHGLYRLWGRKESDMTEQLSLSAVPT